MERIWESAATPAPAGKAEHVTPTWWYALVWAALVALTLLTVAVSRLDLGAANIWAAMGLACAKALLVLLCFMHLTRERPYNILVVGLTLFFAFIFISLTLLDVVQYQPDKIPDYAPAMQR